MANLENPAIHFLTVTNTKLTIRYLGYNYFFPDDVEKRPVFSFTLTNSKGKYTSQFGQMHEKHGTRPTEYEILASLGAPFHGTFEDFCAEFDYDKLPIRDLPKIKAKYKDCVRETKGLQLLFTPTQLRLLASIL